MGFRVLAGDMKLGNLEYLRSRFELIVFSFSNFFVPNHFFKFYFSFSSTEDPPS